MIESTLFHPVALFEAVGAQPVAVTLMEREIVLWRDSAGTVHAAADRCPHRGAALSMGRVVGDTIECGYHGWRFDGSGRCTAVPALPAFVPPPQQRACAFGAREAYGLVWVALQADATALLPAFAAEHDARLRKLNCGPYEVATSAPRIVENFLDMSHFGFVHDGILGSREHTAFEAHRIDATPTGFIATGCKARQPQSSLQATGGAMVDYTYEVNAPYTCVLTKRPETPPPTSAPPPAAPALAIDEFALHEAIALFVCPLTPETSRVWIRLAMNDVASPDATLRAFQDTIFLQDRPILESQRPRRLPISAQAPVTELHSAADRSSAAYRRHLIERGVTYGTC